MADPEDPILKIASLAWAAGVIDGEGCIHVSRNKPAGDRVSVTHCLYLKVTMGHRPTIERLHEIFGVGSVHDRPAGPRVNESFTWLVTSRQAGAVIESIQPYLITKQHEAALALLFLSIPLPPRGGSGGNRVLPPEVVAERERICQALRDAKPCNRFRR